MKDIVSKDIIKAIAFGIILMAFFSLFWLGTAGSNLDGILMWALFIVADFIGLLFIGYGIHLLFVSKKFPKTQEGDKTIKQKIVKKFGLTFGVEGLLIAVCAILLTLSSHQEFIIPLTAIFVGLHFFPMASIFRRRLDYYTASFATIIGLTGLILTITKNISVSKINIFVGIGIGFVTAFYGFFMIRLAQKYKAALII
ncbi:MAG: hypothetical protein JSR11_03925 [Bacteroidetes bacterium]|nr:hypothetical protein [Bacteroidota bacterium]